MTRLSPQLDRHQQENEAFALRRNQFCHAIAAAVREAEKCKETGEEKVILFNLSGHGLIDMASYDQYLAGNLMNYELKDEDIQKNLDEIKNM